MSPAAHPHRVRIRRSRGLVLAASACALLLSACTRQAVQPEPWSPTPSPVPTSDAGCGLQQLPASWQSALKPTAVTPATGVDLLAHDAATGRSLYVRVGSPLSVVVTDPGGNEQRLFDLGADEQPYGAAIEGDWAVLTVGGMNDLGVHAVYARNFFGGEQIEVAVKEADGTVPLTSTPVLYKGVVYVQVAAGPGETAGLRAVDLATQRTTQWSVPRAWRDMVRFGNMLIWRSQADAAVAVDLRTRQVVDIPSALTPIAGATQVTSDGETVVWEGGAAGSEWIAAYRAGWKGVRQSDLPADDTSPSLSSWGRYAVTFANPRRWVIDIETGQYVPLTIEWGGGVVTGGLLATAEMANAKGGSAGLRELDLTQVPSLPACTQ